VKGKLTGIGSSASTTNYTGFSNRAFILGSSQSTAGNTYNVPNYSYYLNGELSSMTYPSGRVVNFAVSAAGVTDPAGRIVGVSGVYSGTTNYASSVQYTPFNALQSVTFGNGLVETRGYSAARMQPVSVTVPGFLTLNYYYCPGSGASCTTNNGNVLSQGIAHVGHGSWTDAYAYDALNRLTSASETGTGSWSQSYGYDAYGNRAVTTNMGLPSLTLATPTSVSQYNTKNQVVNWGYDGAGDLTQVYNYAESFAYDAESRVVTSSVGVDSGSYTRTMGTGGG
jgi:YD repeat-containing protein